MAVAVVAYAAGALELGTHGWSILGGATLIGAIGLCWASERMWGKFTP